MVDSLHVSVEVVVVAAIEQADVAYDWDRCSEVKPQVGFHVDLVGRLLAA